MVERIAASVRVVEIATVGALPGTEFRGEER